MEMLEAIRRRRAVRAYEAGPVDEAAVKALIDAAIQAPSYLNGQPWAFAVIQDGALLRRLSGRVKAHWTETGATDPRMAHLREILASPGYDVFHGADTLVVVCAADDRRSSAEDCFLAGENLILAATAMGLATCPIGLARPVLAEPDVKAELGIPAGIVPVFPVVVGRPHGDTPPVPRNPARIVCWRRGAPAERAGAGSSLLPLAG